MERNIERIATGLKAKGINFRPHVKSHKSLEVARRQLAAGAIGLTSATVVQVSNGQFVLDAGAKGFTKDLPKTLDEYGALPAHPKALIERLFDHHAVVASKGGNMPVVGERIAVIPNHVCPASNLANEFVVVNERGEEVDRWSVDARGRNQ
jgi:D-serine deaminase-like pyridoxal phosphate-dependent protein